MKTPDKKTAFLKAYAKCGSVKDAARTVPIDRTLHYVWLKRDAAYRERFERTRDEAGQELEDSAVEWALVGHFEPNVYQGRFVYPEHEVTIKGKNGEPDRKEFRRIPGSKPYGVWRRSEALHLALLRAFLPERYGRQIARVEVSGSGGGPLEIAERLKAGRARMLAMKAEEEAAARAS
jgi:hypothetical protein